MLLDLFLEYYSNPIEMKDSYINYVVSWKYLLEMMIFKGERTISLQNNDEFSNIKKESY